jgi:serine/threonine-protein kinase
LGRRLREGLSRAGPRLRGFLLLVALSLAAAGTGSLGQLEEWAYGTAMRLADSRPAADVVLVEVDRETLDALGPWPPDPATLAAFHRRVAEMLPAVVAYAWPAGQGRGGVAPTWIDALKMPVATVVAAPYGSGRGAPDPARVSVLAAHALPPAALQPAESMPRAAWVDPPPVEVAELATVGLGPEDIERPPGEPRFALPLVLSAGTLQIPSFGLAVAARALNVPVGQIRLLDGGGIALGGQQAVWTDGAYRVRPFYRAGEGADPVFRRFSFRDVLDGKVPPGALSGKIVLVGPGEGAPRIRVATPVGAWMGPLELSANLVASLLAGDVVAQPWWSWVVAAACWALALLFVVWVLPHLKPLPGLIAGLLLCAMFLNVELLALLSRSVWVPLAWPGALVVIGLSWWILDRRFSVALHEARARLDATRRRLARSYQDQGQLDDALELLRECAVDDALLDQLYHLGLDFERKRLHARAMEAFRFIADHRPEFRDARERARRNQRRMDGFTLPGTGGQRVEDPLAVADGLQKPMLGRYQIDRILGKGEMGVVYLGHDPKINRRVAIKTMALSDEFDDEVLTDVRERFFREASTAGKLNHPNIVTIYDVGEERGLAYIAMDYLTGEPVARYTKPDNLLPVSEVLRLGIQVAAALDYAHRHNVVHRDVKPANIIYDLQRRQATVTDFGVACLTDTSKTRSGVILGTPAFMSPEQLAGRRVDGRSDIFSLGVTLFQLLTGRLPFSGDSISTLMYRIANEQHPDVREYRPDLPECLSSIIDKALAKEPQFRYARAGLMATALRRCVREAAEELSGAKRAPKEKPIFKEVVLD